MAFQPTALRHRTVIARTAMTLIAESADIAVDAELKFHSRDPYAVRVVFSVGSAAAVEWVFSRELLVNGLSAPAGAGDVQVFPCHDGVVFDLTSPSGRARLIAPRRVLADFAEETLDAVPLDSESKYYDLDQEIAMLSGLHLPDASQS